MENNKRILLVIGIILVFIGNNIYWSNKLDRLENDIVSNFYTSIYGIENRIANIDYNIKRELEEQASILTESNFDVTDNVNLDTFTTEINVSITPKEISDDTKVYLKTIDNTFELSKNEYSYDGKVNLDLFYNGTFSVVIETEGVSKVELLRNIYYSTPLPILEFSDRSYFSNDNLHIRFIGHIYTKNDIEIKDIGVLTYINDELHESNITKLDPYSFEIDLSEVEYEQGLNFDVYSEIMIVDSKDITYEYLFIPNTVYYIVENSETQIIREVKPQSRLDGLIRIIDNNGKVVWEK
ncbi:hypothetical protein RJG79_08110 [Mycoplasmatota bacterium WC44]